jgi:hypothetical protein
MKKVLFSAVLLLASSAATVMAVSSVAPAPAEAPKTDAAVPVKADVTVSAAPVTAAQDHHKGGHHGIAHMSKDEIVAQLKSKGEEVEKLGTSLSGAEKDLFSSAIARFNKWVDVISKFSESDTNPHLSAKRAKHELRLAKSIAHHKDGFPAEKIAKWKTDFEALKADVSKLTGDTKSVADTQVANIEGIFADAEKAKDTTLAPLYINAIKYGIDSLKGILHHAEHKAANASKTAITAAPAATAAPAVTIAPAGDAKPAEPAKA